LSCGQVFDGRHPGHDIDSTNSLSRIYANWRAFDCTPLISTTSGSTGSHSTGHHSTGSHSTGHHSTSGGHHSTGSHHSTSGHHSTGHHLLPRGSTSGHHSTGHHSTSGGHHSTGSHHSTSGHTNCGSGVITYEFALISSRIATKAINESGWNAPSSTRCRPNSGLNPGVQPDLVDFQFGHVGTNTSVLIKHQFLQHHILYYVIIRAQQGNSVIYSNSNGQLAGHADDDDDLHPWQQGLIAMGCAIFCLLCLFYLLLLLIVAKRKGEDKYTTTVHRNENVDKL